MCTRRCKYARYMGPGICSVSTVADVRASNANVEARSIREIESIRELPCGVYARLLNLYLARSSLWSELSPVSVPLDFGPPFSWSKLGLGTPVRHRSKNQYQVPPTSYPLYLQYRNIFSSCTFESTFFFTAKNNVEKIYMFGVPSQSHLIET